MFNKEMIEELGGCISKQFPDEGVYRISRVEEWLSTNGYTMEKLGVTDFHELIKEAPELFRTPRYNEDSYVIVRRFYGTAESTGHPADSFFGSKNITLNDDIIEMSQQSLYALTKVLDNGASVQEMKQEIYDAFASARDSGKLDFLSDRYVFPIDYCTDGYLVNGIVTKNISPRGKSLYFSFEKTNIFSSTAIEHKRVVSGASEITGEDKAEIYRLLTASFPFDVPQHMAAVSKLLSDNHFDRTRYGFFKMKDMLAQIDFLELHDVVLGGVPQIMVTLRHSPDYQAAPLNPVQSWGRFGKERFERSERDDRNDRSERYERFDRYDRYERGEPYRDTGFNGVAGVTGVTGRQEYDYSADSKEPSPQFNVEIPSGELEDFCNLPPKPLIILTQYLERSGTRRSTQELRQDLTEDFSKARSEQRLRFYEGKILFPCRWNRADGTPVEITLKPSTYEGKPWFLSFVDTICRDPSQRSIQPGKRLESFAFLGSWNAFLTELADKAIYENWDFAGSHQKEYHILIQYIKYTFYRLVREDKVCISSDRLFACFNTGLVDKHYDDIYACFIPNDPDSETEWKFSGFCTAASRTLGKQIVNYFSPLPQPPVYFERGEQLFFDLSRQLLTDFDHIIIDNINRLPLQFLYDQFNDCPEARGITEELKTADFRRKRELYEQLKSIISDNSRLFIRIQNRLKDSIELAKKRVSRNYKTAIPSYYPKRNTMSLMLPLCLIDEEVPDVALVVEQTRSGNYQGQTILTLAQAYVDARLLCRLNSEWLTTNIGYSGDEQDDAIEEIPAE